MTQTPAELVELAVPYALDALSNAERAEVEAGLASADHTITDAFYDEVRSARETMAAMSAATAENPPAALRDRLLSDLSGQAMAGSVRSLGEMRGRRRWRTTLLSAAAALVIGLTAAGVALSLRPPVPESTAQEVFTARDVHTVSGAIPAGGTATVVFSRDRNAGVLVMNDVPPPSPGTVYQMWLVGDSGMTLAGTMDAQSVAPSTTAVLGDLHNARKLAFTAEPEGGSTTPTGQLIAELPLV